MNRCFRIAVVLLFGATAAAHAQDRTLYYYHGGKLTPSGPVRPGTTQGYERTDWDREIRLRQGSKVCVRVINAHPINYGYSITADVDTSGPKLPDMSQVVALLVPTVNRKGLTPPPTSGDNKLWVAPPQSYQNVAWYINHLTTLTTEVDTARQFVKASDVPEQLSEVENYSAATSGFRRAHKKLSTGFRTAPGHLGDPNLKKTLQTWADSAKKLAANDTALILLTEALRGYGDRIASDFAALKASIEQDAIQETCGKVGTGPTTLALSIARKDTSAAKNRTVGDSLITIVARPPYDRPLVSVHPVGFATMSDDVPDFRVDENGILRGEPDDDVSGRIGVAVNVNLLNFGPSDEVGLGLALGVGAGGGDKVLSDVFIGPVVSAWDAVRVGLGYGFSAFPKRVKGGTVDQPLNLEGQELDDLIESSFRGAFHIVFVLPGLTLK